ncbi:dicarboxylate transporter 2, chloroplastic-like isoform X1 [Diospyros lotus]|uniref:dicarboxylate transporter 2, chloroplastic-like isoform X1 n=1 Tax=Diospyros lotus TaxID=55363 RepID=UPI002259DE22|nr:dicarboxylate transporter 2, chloroplastic-like isoform X1 [Diospyros lotus]
MPDCVANALESFSLSWPAAFGVLQAAYFFIPYLFASQTGHVGALYQAFFAMNLASGVPVVLAAFGFTYVTNLFGALTHYSSGQIAVYYEGHSSFSDCKRDILSSIRPIYLFSLLIEQLVM